MDLLNPQTLLLAALLPAGALVVYGLILWTEGPRGKEEAVAAWHKAVVAGALAAAAFLAPVFVGKAIAIYSAGGGTVGPCLSKLADVQVDFNLVNYANAVNNAMSCSINVFNSTYRNITDTYATIFATTSVTGMIEISSPLSMGLFQAAMPFSGAASGALMALTAATVAAYAAIAFAALAGLGAVLVATERLETIGALIVAAAMAMPPAVAGLADAVAKAAAGMPHLSGIGGGAQALAFWDWGKLVAATSAAAEITAYTALALSIMAAAVAAISYALSRVPQHISVE